MTADYSKMPGPGHYTTKLMTVGHEGKKWNLQSRTVNKNDTAEIAIK